LILGGELVEPEKGGFELITRRFGLGRRLQVTRANNRDIA